MISDLCYRCCFYSFPHNIMMRKSAKPQYMMMSSTFSAFIFSSEWAEDELCSKCLCHSVCACNASWPLSVCPWLSLQWLDKLLTTGFVLLHFWLIASLKQTSEHILCPICGVSRPCSAVVIRVTLTTLGWIAGVVFSVCVCVCECCVYVCVCMVVLHWVKVICPCVLHVLSHTFI